MRWNFLHISVCTDLKMHILFLKFAGYNYQRKVLKFYPQLIPEGMKLNQKVCYWNIPRDTDIT